MYLVNATVTDPYNRLVTGLEKDHFQIYEDGVEQEVATFSSEDVPVSIGVIFDMSGSMSDKVNKARQSAVQFFKTANPQDEFFLVSFNERAELTSRFTSSVEDLQSRLMYTSAKGRTALLDAVYLGLAQMKGAHNSKKAMLIISDGGDNHSRYNVTDVRNFVKEADVQIYSMGLFDNSPATPEETEGPSLLTELCDLTGGRLFRVQDLGELPGHCHQDRHGASQPIRFGIQTQQSIHRRPMEKNQSKGAPSTWFAASQYLFPDGIFRTGSLGSEGSLFFS